MQSMLLGMACGQLPIVEALAHWREMTPDKRAVTYLEFVGRSRAETVLTYAQLAEAVDAMATTLAERTSPGDRVALLMEQGIDYIVAFLACLRVGRIAVPLFAMDAQRSADRVRTVLADSAPTAVIVDRGVDRVALRQLLELEMLYLGPEEAQAGSLPIGCPVPDGETAYLQYTSGSTRAPAGVMVSQSNLATASSQLRFPLGIDEASTVVTWLPYFHDMGLLLGLGACIQAGAHGVHMSPVAFVQQPIRWLQAMTDFQATATVVPNFALDHATTRVSVQARSKLDLSNLRVLGNGSEPIRAGSLEKFTEMYKHYGFTHERHLPGYGLAETTLVVTSSLPGEGPKILFADRDRLAQGFVSRGKDRSESAALVSSGRPIAQSVRIVNPDSLSDLSDGQVGEVWVQGPNVCLGFYGNEEMTTEVFRAESSDLPGVWLRTGDLGAFVDDELYIVGRRKDLIIVGGKNHYPADIEGTVQERLFTARPNGIAVFSYEQLDTAEVAVVVVELDPKSARDLDFSELSRLVRSIVSERHELALHDVVLARPGEIPKTTSGKIRRHACAEKYSQGKIIRAIVGAV